MAQCHLVFEQYTNLRFNVCSIVIINYIQYQKKIRGERQISDIFIFGPEANVNTCSFYQQQYRWNKPQWKLLYFDYIFHSSQKYVTLTLILFLAKYGLDTLLSILSVSVVDDQLCHWEGLHTGKPESSNTSAFYQLYERLILQSVLSWLSATGNFRQNPLH